MLLHDTSDPRVKSLVPAINLLFHRSYLQMYHGATYDDIKELYYDICQLDVMSGIEIDKAKKEFIINNSKELTRLRSKYENDLREYEEAEDGTLIKKKKTPHFFSHIVKQKNFTTKEILAKKHFCKYHTSMDYLQTIVNGFKIKNPYKKDWLPFTAVLDASLFRSNNVNQKQINKIYSILKKYINDRKNIYASETDSKEDKRIQDIKLKEDLIADIECETIGFSTMYRLLSSLESKENSQIKNILLEILYLCGNESFNKAIINSSNTILQLEDDGDDINIFGIYFGISERVITKKE